MNGRKDNDIFFALIAINLVPGLSGTARRVAGALIQHYNRKTGQCDPSVERMSVLLGVDLRTIRRATSELSQSIPPGLDVLRGDALPFPLFRKESRGGRSQRASYSPIWANFRIVVEEWKQLSIIPTNVLARIPNIRSKRRTKTLTKLSTKQWQDCPLNPDKIATQTYRRNLKKQPKHNSSTENAHAREVDKSALEAARRRIQLSINAHPTELQLIVWGLPTHIHAQAELSEVEHKGSGIRILIDAVAALRMNDNSTQADSSDGSGRGKGAVSDDA